MAVNVRTVDAVYSIVKLTTDVRVTKAFRLARLLVAAYLTMVCTPIAAGNRQRLRLPM
jgi:hypothetical protein